MLRRTRRLKFLLAGSLVLCLFLAIYPTEYPRVLPQKDIHLLQEVPTPEEGQRILVFSPHPDDETIALGGYIAQACTNGADVRVALITDGNWRGREQRRYVEFRKVMSILGVNENELVFMGFPDSGLRYIHEYVLYYAFQKQISEFDPDIVIYPHVKDSHADHYTAGRILDRLMAAAPDRMLSYQYLVHYEMFYPQPRKFDPNLYLLPPLSLAASGGGWGRSMLSPEIMDLKIKALFTYESQMKDPLLRSLIRASIRRNELIDFPGDRYQPNI